jgi:hypothetical protein
MRPSDQGRVGKCPNCRENVLREFRVASHLKPFFIIQFSGFIEDIVADSELAYIVEKSSSSLRQR